MALKPKRLIDPFGYDVSYYSQSEMERGGIVVAATVGSGTAMEDALNVVEYAADPSGKVPLGVLLHDTENVNLSKHYVNPYAAVDAQGTKTTINSKITVTTNMVYPGLTIAKNESAYLGPSGLLTNTFVNTEASPYVGEFRGTKDENGYVKVIVNLPAGS